MITDQFNLDRTAQDLIVECLPGHGAPPAYEDRWLPVWYCQVEDITINAGKNPSVARLFFPELRWQESGNLRDGDRIRILSPALRPAERTCLFSGFLVNRRLGFGGGLGHTGREASQAHETNARTVLDHRWLLNMTSPVYGQWARTADDYMDFDSYPFETPTAGKATFLSGRRCVFNADSKPNRDPDLLTWTNTEGDITEQLPIFCDPARGEYWTARQILRYLISALVRPAESIRYFPLVDPDQWPGIENPAWDSVLYHLSCEGLSVLESLALLTERIGWNFREDYLADGTAYLTLYETGGAVESSHSATAATIRHRLYAPAVGESVAVPVAAGAKLLWSMRLDQDTADCVNEPWGLGGVHRVELTTELVPAWSDSDLVPDTSDDLAHLYYTEADLASLADPQSQTFVSRYHARGATHASYRDVGRKWALNETGRYTGGSTDRGAPWDPAAHLPAQWALGPDGRRQVAPLSRRLLEPLTRSGEAQSGSGQSGQSGQSGAGIRVEFSFDAGTTWHVLPGAIESLADEAGIRIAEANLAELAPVPAETISGGDLDGVAMNYWTSLCDDVLNSRSFKTGGWRTRCRVTCSLQLDQRLRSLAPRSDRSGAAFPQARLYDLSSDYRHTGRADDSYYAELGLSADVEDDRSRLDARLAALRSIHEDAAISGLFVLERLWTGSGYPEFQPGDAIVAVEGRGHSLAAAFAGRTVFPEIVQVVYKPRDQHTELVTADLRFATRRLRD